MDKRGYLYVFLLSISCLLHDVTSADLTANIFLRLFHRDGTYQDVNVRNASQLVPKLDKNEKTVIFVHGFSENVNFKDVQMTKDVYLKYTKQNFLALDYRDVSQQNYFTSVDLYRQVGELLAKGVNEMMSSGISSDKLHIIGHSLGSQVAGIAGRNTASKISRITGLDPAGPLFYIFNEHLSKADAQFVDIIHTDMGFYGLALDTGHVDFYPNLGHRPQPGCSIALTEILNPCPHVRSYEFYAESVKNVNAFIGIKCDDSEQFITSTCAKDETAIMGFDVPRNARGKYYLMTNSASPYGLGSKGTVFHLFNLTF
ncbi:unnamed protein product [Xylocopa violacea]|uniref:phospholipase A1 n=1 Tax=Xylocopa violacea TaxID=135666 RepID=A0ABP1NME2_XYLVO